jgi:hypothetical protein
MRSSTGYTGSLLAEATARSLGQMMNVMVWRKDDVLYTVFIPRSAHRPACYFAPEAEAIHVSPGTLDMAGVMVATDEPTFNRLSIQTVEDIIREVGLTTEEALERARQIIRELEEGHIDQMGLHSSDLNVVTYTNF